MIVFGQNTIIFITFKLFACRTDSLEKLPSVILQHSGHYNTEGRIQLWYKFTLVLILYCWNLRVFLSILKALLAMPKRFFNVLVFFSLTSVCTGQVCKFIRCWKILSVCSDFRSLSLPPSSFCFGPICSTRPKRLIVFSYPCWWAWDSSTRSSSKRYSYADTLASFHCRRSS